jgi:hypothetical protein
VIRGARTPTCGPHLGSACSRYTIRVLAQQRASLPRAGHFEFEQLFCLMSCLETKAARLSLCTSLLQLEKLPYQGCTPLDSIRMTATIPILLGPQIYSEWYGILYMPTSGTLSFSTASSVVPASRPDSCLSCTDDRFFRVVDNARR